MTASVKTVLSGKNNLVINVTGVFSTSDETDTVIVDRSALTGPDGVNSPSKLRIDELVWNISGTQQVLLEWDNTGAASADETVERLVASGIMEYRQAGGKIPTNAASILTGTVGDLLLSTIGGASGDSYSILITIKLKQ